MWQKYIAIDPNVMMGKPVIKGTRITVELILEKLGAGETFEQLVAEYPSLSADAIKAAIAFAAEILKGEIVYPLEVAR